LASIPAARPIAKITAMEVAGDGIMVNGIARTYRDTYGEGSRCPVGRLAKPEEMAAAVGFLDEAGYITGATFDIDGGTLMI
jgi:3-oxoacyl-[acyl-carrier protein] reductase